MISRVVHFTIQGYVCTRAPLALGVTLEDFGDKQGEHTTSFRLYSSVQPCFNFLHSTPSFVKAVYREPWIHSALPP
jgi:hypothetical protein